MDDTLFFLGSSFRVLVGTRQQPCQLTWAACDVRCDDLTQARAGGAYFWVGFFRGRLSRSCYIHTTMKMKNIMIMILYLCLSVSVCLCDCTSQLQLQLQLRTSDSTSDSTIQRSTTNESNEQFHPNKPIPVSIPTLIVPTHRSPQRTAQHHSPRLPSSSTVFYDATRTACYCRFAAAIYQRRDGGAFQTTPEAEAEGENWRLETPCGGSVARTVAQRTGRCDSCAPRGLE
ncbi:hypothetical protein EX30DRAFT_246106 [Ascodesmis nigricans]|uniref:Uncharacterized protein n=1 Tax=Ascodesmis nigricans TaxID=341454 RepID=A0A4S2MHY5_9PEZI|nr:hypothetical protein EX30DRAFT_246106 [Ascodesmis nigricans]